jgi:hypothetical protein
MRQESMLLEEKLAEDNGAGELDVEERSRVKNDCFREFWEEKLGTSEFSDYSAYLWTRSLHVEALRVANYKMLPIDPNVWVAVLKLAGKRVPFNRNNPAAVY